MVSFTYGLHLTPGSFCKLLICVSGFYSFKSKGLLYVPRAFLLENAAICPHSVYAFYDPQQI